MTKFSIFLFLFILLNSCEKKSKEVFLVGDSMSLIGEWKWLYTEEIDDKCLCPECSLDYHDPSTENFECQIKITQTGRIIVLKSNGYLEGFEFTKMDIQESQSGFRFWTGILSGYVDEHSLEIDKFPYTSDYACDEVINYYQRIE